MEGVFPEGMRDLLWKNDEPYKVLQVTIGKVPPPNTR